MDSRLISKILRISAPDAIATETINPEQPLLEPASCRALASGLVRLLRVSSTAAAPRARTALLRNIRALTTHSHSHHRSSQHLQQLLDEYYSQLAFKHHEHACENLFEDLNSFLAVQALGIRQESKVDNTTMCLAQAFLNINPQNPYLEQISRKVLICDDSEMSIQKFLQEVWEKDIFTSEQFLDQLTLKAKPIIEKAILEAAYRIVVETDANCSSDVLQLRSIQNLLNKSSKSRICFQMCCSILNTIFIMSNFNLKLLSFTEMFVDRVRSRSNKDFINLYDDGDQSLVMILSCDQLLGDKNIIESLRKLRAKSETRFIMLLSHHPNWLEQYFDNILV